MRQQPRRIQKGQLQQKVRPEKLKHISPKNKEAAACALSGLQYNVGQSLGEALTPDCKAVIL